MGYTREAKKLKKKAANKVIKAQKRKEIDIRKVIRAYNKANGIIVQRGPYKKKQLIYRDFLGSLLGCAPCQQPPSQLGGVD